MHLILTGATGMVGSGVLAHILSMSGGEVTRLSILSRGAVPMVDDFGKNRKEGPDGKPTIKIIHHTDYTQYPPELLDDLKGAHGVIWAQGISQNDVSKDQYIKITKDYPLAAAKAFSTLSDKFNFVYVSGEGATLTPGRFTPLFGSVKGETEAALLEMGKKTPGFNVYSARPGGVDPMAHPEVLKQLGDKVKGVKMMIYRLLFPAFRVFYPSGVIPTKQLGQVLTQLAMGNGEKMDGLGVEGEGRTIRNIRIRKMAGI